MSYVVKGESMPRCCYNCFALDKYDDYLLCRITKELRGYNFDKHKSVMEYCPLIELPKQHGRLIDADAYQYSGDLIDEPTIIEAEDGK